MSICIGGQFYVDKKFPRFILKCHRVYPQCKTVQVGRVKTAEDKERRGYRKRQKRKSRNIYFLSFLSVVSFQMDVVRKVEEVWRIKGDVKTFNRLPSAM